MAQIWICSPQSRFSDSLTRELTARGHWVECPGDVLHQIAELRFLLPDLIVLEGYRESDADWEDFYHMVEENPCLPVLLLPAADADAVESALGLTVKFAPGCRSSGPNRSDRFSSDRKESPGKWLSYHAASGGPS